MNEKQLKGLVIVAAFFGEREIIIELSDRRLLFITSPAEMDVELEGDPIECNLNAGNAWSSAIQKRINWRM